MNRVCKQCSFEGDNFFFRKKDLCKNCNNSNKREERRIKSGRKIHLKSNKNGYKICRSCDQEQLNDNFTFSELKRNYSQCKTCYYKYYKIWKDNSKEKQKIIRKKYREDHKKELLELNRKNYSKFKEKRLKQKKEYYLKNKEYKSKYIHNYYENNKNKLIDYQKEYRKNNIEKGIEYRKKNRNKENIRVSIKRKENPGFRLRENISRSIRAALKNNGCVKNCKSIKKYLPYALEELKQHLEAQFEPWMTWENWGKYIPKTWNDEDQSTWVWNIDHIIPQSKLLYVSMEDDNFKKCWALENLRPLSAKANIIKGNRI